MFLEIEYYKYDTLLVGKAINVSELRKQLNKVEALHDTGNDNFIELLCRMFQWTVISKDEIPNFTYDRDIKKLYSRLD